MEELHDVTVVEALELLSAGALLLDVREENEWEAGHAAQALHIALSEVPDRVDTLKKDQRIVAVCRSGQRSARAGQFLTEQGFDVVNLHGGMLAWAGADEPLVGNNAEPTII
jgi:rhodanese-related sulfurtransferase